MSKKKNKITRYRQGDVLISATAVEPTAEETRDKRGVVLAEGEATGHHHRIDPSLANAAHLFGYGSGAVLRVDREVPLRHEEHKEIYLKSGKYEIDIQREYTPEQVRQVVD